MQNSINGGRGGEGLPREIDEVGDEGILVKYDIEQSWYDTPRSPNTALRAKDCLSA